MTRTSSRLILWLIIGIALPAVVSSVLNKRLAPYYGVQISTGNKSWKTQSLKEGLRYFVEHAADPKTSLRTYLWVPPNPQRHFVLIGIRRDFFFDGYRVPDLSKKQRVMSHKPVPAGLHFIEMRPQSVPSDLTSLEFMWTRGNIEPEEIASNQLYAVYPRPAIVYQTSLAQLLGIIARLNCVLVVVVPLVLLIFNHVRPVIRRNQILLIAAFLLMFLVRINGISYQLREGLHPDERAVENTVAHLRFGSWKPDSYLYTPGFHYICATVENLIGWVVGSSPAPNFVPRLLSCLFSFLSCVLVYSIGAALFSSATGLIASILFGFSFMPVLLAHFGIIEPAMVFFFLLAFRLILNLSKEAGGQKFLIAGVASGLAIGVKQTAALIIVPLISVCLFEYRIAIFGKSAIKKLCFWLGGCVIAYLVLSPYTLLDASNFIKSQMFQFKFLSGQTHTTIYFAGEQSGPKKILSYLQDGIGYPLIFAALAGIAFTARRSVKAIIAILSIAVLFFAIASLAKAPPYHYPLLLCPFIALLAAAAVEQIRPLLRFTAAVPVFLSLLILIPSLMRVLKLETILIGTDTRRKASEWCYRNLATNAAIDYEFFGPRLLIPIFRTRMVPLFTRGLWEQYVTTGTPDYYIMDSNTAGIFLTKSRKTFPEEHEWYAKIRQNADVVQEFSGLSLAEYNPHILIYKLRKSAFTVQQQPYSLTHKSARIKQRKPNRRKP